MDTIYLNLLEQMQSKLHKIALFLEDNDEEKADALLKRTNELASKYDTYGEFERWVQSIMKQIYLREFSKAQRK